MAPRNKTSRKNKTSRITRKSQKKVSNKYTKEHKTPPKYYGSVTFIHKFHIPKSEYEKYGEKFVKQNGVHPKGYSSANKLKVLQFKGSRETTSGGLGHSMNKVVVNYELDNKQVADKFKKICMSHKGDIIKSCKISKQ